MLLLVYFCELLLEELLLTGDGVLNLVPVLLIELRLADLVANLVWITRTR